MCLSEVTMHFGFRWTVASLFSNPFPVFPLLPSLFSASLSVLQRSYSYYFQDFFANQLLPRRSTGGILAGDRWHGGRNNAGYLSPSLSASRKSLVVTVSCEAPAPARELGLPWPQSSLSEPAGFQLLLSLQLLNFGDITSSLGPCSSGDDSSFLQLEIPGCLSF